MQVLKRLLKPARPLQTLESIAAYDLWAESYPAHAHNPLMQAEETAMLSLLPNLEGLSVLDLACGTGRYARLAESHGAKNPIGLDNSLAMLQSGELSAGALATSEAIPLAANSLDLVICALALGHLPHLESSLSEISRVLKPQAYALISDFHPFQFLTGAQRSFKDSNGRAYAVEHHVHLYADYHRLSRQVGLSICEVLEPSLHGKFPVVLVLKLQKMKSS